MMPLGTQKSKSDDTVYTEDLVLPRQLPLRLMGTKYWDTFINEDLLPIHKSTFERGNPPKGLYEKLLRELRYITPEDFEIALASIKQDILKFVDVHPYFFVTARGREDYLKSGERIIEKLGLPISLGILDGKELLAEGADAFLKNIPEDARFIFIEDAMYSGDQSEMVYKALISALRAIRRNQLFGAFMVGCTSLAMQILNRNGISKVNSYYSIPLVSEIFTPEEQAYLAAVPLGDSFSCMMAASSSKVTTIINNRIPDNFLNGMTKDSPLDFIGDDFTETVYLINNDVLRQSYNAEKSQARKLTKLN